MKKEYIKTYCKIIITICIFFILSILFFTTLINDVHDEKEYIQNQHNEIEFEYVYNILLDNLDSAKNNARTVADEIEMDIKDYYGDNLNKLKKDLDDSIYPKKLLDIFKNNIKNKNFKNLDNSRNGMIVANKSGVLCDMSLDKDRESLSYSSTIRYWKYEYPFHDNRILCKNAISKLTNQSNDLIVWDNGIDKYNIKDGMNKSILKQIYLEEGIEGFKNYDFLCAAYINEFSDIFGQEDIIGTQYNVEVHKFIVVQKINLYDIISKDNKFILDKDMYNAINYSYSHIIYNMFILGIFLSLVIIVTLCILSTLFNKLLKD